jgi:hypothetical protein
MPTPITHLTAKPATKLRPDRVIDICDGAIILGIAHLGE